MKNAVPSEKIGTGAAFFSPNAWTHRKNVSSSVASPPFGGFFFGLNRLKVIYAYPKLGGISTFTGYSHQEFRWKGG